jgi:hypothetical protein
MEKSALSAPDEAPDGSTRDLARRLARYRRRVEVEGRKRSLQILDVAIRDASGRGPECA